MLGGRRKYTIGKHLSRFFSKKIPLIFLVSLCEFGGRGLKFDKQILNQERIFCNTFFQIFLTRFQEKCNTFFSIFFTLIFAIRQEKNHFDFVEIFSHFAIINIRITENAF